MPSKAKSLGFCGLGLVAQYWFIKFQPPPLPTLPNDIIYYILLLLPVKSLGRCRCVCREWKNLLTGSTFLNNHLHYGHRRLIVSFSESQIYMDLEEPSNLVMTKQDFPWKERGHVIMGSCNGLLLMLVAHNYLFLWNPCTRKYKQLPPSPKSFKKDMFYGFGYEMSIDGCYNYKVVRGESHGTGRHEVEVYSRKTNSWRRIEDIPYRNLLPVKGTFVNGFLHWIGSRGHGKNFRTVIASLDLAMEEFGEIMLPDFGQVCFLLDMGLLNGMLCVMCANHRGWDVYAMKEYGVPESWIIFINIPPVWCTTIGIPYFVSMTVPLYWMKNGELVMQIKEDKVLMYDPRKNTFKDLIIAESQSITYVESIESP